MYDFIDIGSSKGGSVRHASKVYGPNGYGIDIDCKKVAKARAAGLDVRCMGIKQIVDSARWVTCMHVIEHLPGREAAADMIASMIEIATEGVYISFPYFDDDGHLYSMGLKFFWSDWTGHPYHCTSLELHNILRDLGVNYEIYRYGEILSTSAPEIIPLSAPKDSFQYNPNMGSKKIEAFVTYKELRCKIYKDLIT